MKIEIGSRQSGKTVKAIKDCAENGGYIVCFSHEEAYRVANVASNLGYDIHFPITYIEFASGYYHAPGIKRFVIDNAELVLQAIAKVPIGMITISSNTEDDIVMEDVDKSWKQLRHEKINEVLSSRRGKVTGFSSSPESTRKFMEEHEAEMVEQDLTTKAWELTEGGE